MDITPKTHPDLFEVITLQKGNFKYHREKGAPSVFLVEAMIDLDDEAWREQYKKQCASELVDGEIDDVIFEKWTARLTRDNARALRDRKLKYLLTPVDNAPEPGGKEFLRVASAKEVSAILNFTVWPSSETLNEPPPLIDDGASNPDLPTASNP